MVKKSRKSFGFKRKILYCVKVWLKMSMEIKEFCFKGGETGAKIKWPNGRKEIAIVQESISEPPESFFPITKARLYSSDFQASRG